MSESLREITKLLTIRSNFLGIQSEVIGVTQRLFEVRTRLFDVAGPRQAFDIPESTQTSFVRLSQNAYKRGESFPGCGP